MHLTRVGTAVARTGTAAARTARPFRETTIVTADTSPTHRLIRTHTTTPNTFNVWQSQRGINYQTRNNKIRVIRYIARHKKNYENTATIEKNALVMAVQLTLKVTDFAVKTRPSVLVLGREGKRPGNWELSQTVGTPVDQINRDRTARENSVLDIPPITGDQTPSKYTTGDVVYYKAHTKLYARMAPNKWGTVKLEKQVGKGVFLTDQQLAQKMHVSCLERASTTHK
ncbi:Hypothetical protein CINCED_3A023959 [Cinara cedri]|uniref:Uncharacterized protein n=1 Tax=Cinara cedri TaxID=506608 RepID=A0A5E4MLR4_9HEMI|nr:Hypothetical protein CINCED_3A023959 [Cinara cedri]